MSYISRALPTTYDLVQDQTAPSEATCGGQKIPDVSEEDNISKTPVKEEIINPWMPQETENEGCDDCDVQSEFPNTVYHWIFLFCGSEYYCRSFAICIKFCFHVKLGFKVFLKHGLAQNNLLLLIFL